MRLKQLRNILAFIFCLFLSAQAYASEFPNLHDLASEGQWDEIIDQLSQMDYETRKTLMDLQNENGQSVFAIALTSALKQELDQEIFQRLAKLLEPDQIPEGKEIANPDPDSLPKDPQQEEKTPIKKTPHRIHFFSMY